MSALKWPLSSVSKLITEKNNKSVYFSCSQMNGNH